MYPNTNNLQHNVTMWEKLGVVYWGITKCASTTIKSHLCFFEYGIKEESINIHRPKYAKYIDPIYKEGFFNFTIIRNPTDRFLSMYNDLFKTRQSRGKKASINLNWDINEFASYLSNVGDEDLDVHFKSQSSFIKDQRIFKIKMENIKEEWCLKIPAPEKIIHKSNTYAMNGGLTDTTLNLLEKRYSLDYKMWKS